MVVKATTKSKSAKIRERLGHPIVDTDGHAQEVIPVLLDYVKQVAGSRVVVEGFTSYFRDATMGPDDPWWSMSKQERFDKRVLCPSWWSTPTRNTLDRASAHLPGLLYRRMDELGFDFGVVYPTRGIGLPSHADEEMRRAGSRAFNMYQADMFRDFADRLTPAAVIPMHSPQEAIEELDYATKVLGLKAVMIASYVQRPVAATQRQGHVGRGHWIDTFGIDSAYDYDPVWARCVELGVAPAAHSAATGWDGRQSVSNWQYNLTGHFGTTGEALCRSLFMGGVTRRFPTLKFAFLEGGVTWACNLYANMVSRWRKRNPEALLTYLDPQLLDVDALMRLFEQFGNQRVLANLGAIRANFHAREPRPDNLDHWSACGIDRAEQVRDLFESNFYFGCEGDDPFIAWASATHLNPLGARLRAVLGSDIGHWDVQDMSRVVEEAYEAVEHGQMSEGDFRDFVFTNPVTLYGSMNPDFFKGTPVESAAAKVLSELKSTTKI